MVGCRCRETIEWRDALTPGIEFGLAAGAGLEINNLTNLDRFLGAASDAGFTAVSLIMGSLGDDLKGAAKLLETHNLRCSDIVAMQVGSNEAKTLTHARAIAPAVEAFGAEFVLTFFWTKLNEESLDRLGRCADIIGTRTIIEFGAGGPIESLAVAEEVVAGVGRDKVALLADTFHFFRRLSTLEMLDTVNLDDLPIVQFTDALPQISDDYLDETTNRRAWAGLGELPLNEFADRLLRRGWTGLVSVEVLSPELRKLEVEEFARQAFATTQPYWIPG